MKKIYPQYRNLKFLERYYLDGQFTRALTYLRRYSNLLFICEQDGDLSWFYVPTTKKELEPYIERLSRNIRAMEKSIERAQKFIENKQFNQIEYKG